MDYKAKYLELRTKLIESTDLAYRLGYEQGFEKGQSSQQQMQQQQVDEFGNPIQQNNGFGSEQPQIVNGQESKFKTEEKSPFDVDNSTALNMDGTMGGGSELDQHIDQLEGLVKKGERPTLLEIRSVVGKISDLRKNQKNIVERAEGSVAWQKEIINNLINNMDKKTETTLEGLEKIIAAEVKESE
jgi:hypothetical protein